MSQIPRARGSGATHVERLEARALMSGVGDPTHAPGPEVRGVFLDSPRWMPAFRQRMLEFGWTWIMQYGGQIGPSTEPATNGWTNATQVRVRFSYSSMIVEPGHLRVAGVNVPQYGFTGFEYQNDPVHGGSVATWTLDRPIGTDRVLFELDADNPRGVRTDGDWLLDGDGDGRAGGDLRVRLDSDPGDITGGGVTGNDALFFRSRLRRGPAGLEIPDHLPYDDVNADGRADLRDLVEIRMRVGTNLPASYPTLSAAPTAAAAARTRPATRGMFSEGPILA